MSESNKQIKLRVVKWDSVTKTYSNPFEIEHVGLLSEDWEAVVECPSCHKKSLWGDMVNCGDYFTENGLWIIPVCPKCAEKIWKAQEAENRRKNNL